MIWLRFAHTGREMVGSVEGNSIRVVDGNIYSGEYRETGEVLPLDSVSYLPPCRPGKIVCVGLNYRDHAEEMKMDLPSNPILFLKPPSALLGHGGGIVYPAGVRRLDYEAELVAVIGRQARHVSAGDALSYVFGYTCGNDVTARDLQKSDQQWTRAKSFDTFCPLGPWIATGIDASDLEVSLEVNGERKQYSRTSQLAFGIPELVSFISGVMTLEPGDVIMTGTPSGVGPLSAGDRVSVRISQIGDLTSIVVQG